MRLICTVVLVIALAGCQKQEEKSVKLETQMDKVSYSIGLNIGNNLRKDSINISPDAFLRGVMDAAVDSSRRIMSEQEMQETMIAFQQEHQKKQMENARTQGEKNKRDGETFLAENAKKPGVVTLPSGLQYKVITEGKGKKPGPTSKVKTNYVGKLIDGSEFDSSYKRGQPAEFPVNQVIKGWSEALQLMRVGSKWELYVPASLAYGEQGAGRVIPPNSTLIFTIELLSVE